MARRKRAIQYAAACRIARNGFTFIQAPDYWITRLRG